MVKGLLTGCGRHGYSYVSFFFNQSINYSLYVFLNCVLVFAVSVYNTWSSGGLQQVRVLQSPTLLHMPCHVAID